MMWRVFAEFCARRIRTSILFSGLALLLAPGIAQAQISTASLNGTVRDQSGAVVRGASVLLRNVDTNVERTTATNDAGTYVLVNIIPGHYTLTVKKEGFTSETEPTFELAVNQSTTMDFSLRIGSQNDIVNVEAEATLQTSSAELGTVIDRRAVDDLPLNGRNFTQLLDLTPGVSVANTSQNRASDQFQGNAVGSFSFPSINGQTNRSNLFLMDGVNDQESFASTYSVPPIVDDIQEFKVDSHNDDAQFGGVLGGVINVVTKSGTNSFRGEGWEFLRNSYFDAKDPFTGISTLHQNEFGANIGGPVLLPHYKGRNRTFFFGSFQQTIRHVLNGNQTLIPTVAQINGDFTKDANGVPTTDVNGIPTTLKLYNPYSTTGTGSRTQFMCTGGIPNAVNPVTKLQAAGGTPCNIIPAALIDPNMQAVSNLLYGGKTPNKKGVAGVNYQQNTLTIQDPISYNFRIDHTLTQKDQLFGRFSHIDEPRNVPGIYGQASVNDAIARQIAVSWNHTFGPTAVLNAEFGRNLVYSATSNLLPVATAQKFIAAGGYDPSFDCTYIKTSRKCYFIGVNYSDGGFGSFQESANPAYPTDIWEGRADFTKTLGRHTFRMGADWNTNSFHETLNSGHLDFSNVQTASTVTGSVKGTGLSFASLLLGVPTGVTYRNVYESEYGGQVDAFYFQDQWKVTDRLTINLGARYDMTLIPVYGSNADGNNSIGNFNWHDGTYIMQRSAPDCASTGNVAPCIPGGTLPANVLVSPDGRLWHNSYDNIQPRIGFAYRMWDRTVVRGGYGRFYDNWAAVIQMSQNQQGTWPSVGQLIQSFNNTNSAPSITAENPLQGANQTPPPTPFEQNNWFVDPKIKNPYADQWNFGVQQAVTQNMTLTVNYVGSMGHRLDVGVTAGSALTPGPGPIPQVHTASCYTLPVSNPKSCSPAAIAAEGRWPFPYMVPTHYDESAGKSWYDALQASLTQKTTFGLSFLVAYTYSKTLDIGADEWFGTGTQGTSVQNSYNLAPEKSVAGYDLPQIITGSWTYELPFGKGKRFSSGMRPLDMVFGDWQVNGIVSYTSGLPFNVVASNSIPNVGAVNGNSERANLLGNPHVAQPSVSGWFNTTAFAPPASFTFGNLSRNALRADTRKDVDFSVFRSFPLGESRRLEFRGEAFNVTNTPIWGTPRNNVSTDPVGVFGHVSSTANGYSPRQLQFAMKVYF